MKISSPNEIKNLIKIPFIRRSLHRSLYQHISAAKEITILYGPRQVGKSQEIYKSIEQLLRLKKNDVFFYNLDIIPEEFESPDVFLSTIFAQKKHPKEKTFVFLDEAQRLENVGLFVKYLYDQNKNIKFVLTGSASLDIKAKIKEPLTGRKKEFFLTPLTLREILDFRGVKTRQIKESFPLLEKILEDYLLYGGYPEIVALESKAQKIEKIAEISQSYTLRDIASFFEIGNFKTLQMIVRFLAENIGCLLSKENISRISGVSLHQTEKVLEALEKSFVIKLMPPFYKSPSKELTHRPKIYFQDLGIRNAVLNKTEPSLILSDKGQLFENAMATEMISLFGSEQVKFWRTNNQTEVDFVISGGSGQSSAVEAKYQWDSKNPLPKNLRSLRKQYPETIKKIEVLSRSNYWKMF